MGLKLLFVSFSLYSERMLLKKKFFTNDSEILKLQMKRIFCVSFLPILLLTKAGGKFFLADLKADWI